MALFNLLLLLASASAVLAAPQFDKYLLTPNTIVSQTCIGSFIQPLSTTMTSQYADWIVDLENQRLRSTVGSTNQQNYMQLLSFSSTSYVINFNPATNSLYCYTIPNNFQSILNLNMYPNVRYLGDAVVNNLVYHMFAGLTPNPIVQSSTPSVAFFGNASSALPLMPVITSTGFNYYSYSNVTTGTPAASWFTLPSICNATTPTCSPACGSNAQCVNQTCVCYSGYYGNATNGCVASVSNSQPVGSISISYDQYVLQNGAGAVSQTCLGTYTNPTTGYSVYSAWVQNVQNMTIRWDVGMPGVSGSVSYYFMAEAGYTVIYTMDNGMICNKTNQMTYSQAFNNMFYPTMRYMGVNTMYNNVSCRMYAGTGVPNPYSRATSMIKYISTSGSQFYFLAMLNMQGYVYYDYPNVTLGAPAKSWFIIPPPCNGINLPGTGSSDSGSGSENAAKCLGGSLSLTFFSCLVFAFFMLRLQ